MSEEPKPSRKALVWLGTTILGALIGLALKDFWEAPRPHVELVAVEFRPADLKNEVEIGLVLASQIRDHFFFPDLNQLATTEEVRGAIERAGDGKLGFENLLDILDQLISQLQTRTDNLDDRRRDFLSLWFRGDTGQLLDTLTKSVLVEKAAELPESYSQHPEGLEDFSVAIGPGQTVNLSALDEAGLAEQESSVAGPVNVYARVKQEARLTNALRRLWLSLEAEHFVPILQEVKALVQQELDKAEAFRGELEALVSLSNPDHIEATVVVTNRGRRPMAIRLSGLLWIRVPSRLSDQPNEGDTIPVMMTSTTNKTEVAVVEAGKAKIVRLISKEPTSVIASLNEALAPAAQSQIESRLEQLYHGGGLWAAIGLAKAGVDASNSRIKPSRFRLVGPTAKEAVYEHLREAGI